MDITEKIFGDGIKLHDLTGEGDYTFLAADSGKGMEAEEVSKSIGVPEEVLGTVVEGLSLSKKLTLAVAKNIGLNWVWNGTPEVPQKWTDFVSRFALHLAKNKLKLSDISEHDWRQLEFTAYQVEHDK